jgi:hypothetical protein
MEATSKKGAGRTGRIFSPDILDTSPFQKKTQLLSRRTNTLPNTWGENVWQNSAMNR